MSNARKSRYGWTKDAWFAYKAKASEYVAWIIGLARARQDAIDLMNDRRD